SITTSCCARRSARPPSCTCRSCCSTRPRASPKTCPLCARRSNARCAGVARIPATSGGVAFVHELAAANVPEIALVVYGTPGAEPDGAREAADERVRVPSADPAALNAAARRTTAGCLAFLDARARPREGAWLAAAAAYAQLA